MWVMVLTVIQGILQGHRAIFFGEATEPSCVPVHTFEIPILKDAKMRISAALSGFKRTSEPWDHMHTNDQVSSVLLPISRVVPHGL